MKHISTQLANETYKLLFKHKGDIALIKQDQKLLLTLRICVPIHAMFGDVYAWFEGAMEDYTRLIEKEVKHPLTLTHSYKPTRYKRMDVYQIEVDDASVYRDIVNSNFFFVGCGSELEIIPKLRECLSGPNYPVSEAVGKTKIPNKTDLLKLLTSLNDDFTLHYEDNSKGIVLTCTSDCPTQVDQTTEKLEKEFQKVKDIFAIDRITSDEKTVYKIHLNLNILYSGMVLNNLIKRHIDKLNRG